MSFRCEHIFTGLIDGKNITQEKLDYTISGTEERIKKVERIIKKYDKFLSEYFDEHFLSVVSKYDELSLDNNICRKIENIADYILLQVPKEEKTEYKFYSDYRDFEKEIKKELNLEMVTDSTDGDNILHFLVENGKNFKKTKEIVLNENDYKRDDILGQILREYRDYKNYLTELKKTGTSKEKYYCNKNIPLITKDMIYCKEHLDGVFGTNLRNALSDSEKPNFDDIDFFNIHHIECMLKSSMSSLNFDEDYSMQLNYFKELYKKMVKHLDDKEKNVCEILSWGNSSVTQINDVLKVGYETNNIKNLYEVDTKELKKIIYKICKGIIREHEKSLKNFLDQNYKKGNYIKFVEKKKCTKCGNIKPLSSFWERELSKDGKMGICIDCYKK